VVEGDEEMEQEAPRLTFETFSSKVRRLAGCDVWFMR
jgi:hypothetical protein